MAYTFRLNIKENIGAVLSGVKKTLGGMYRGVDRVERKLQGFDRAADNVEGLGNAVEHTDNAFKKGGKSSKRFLGNIITLSGTALGLNRGLGKLAGSLGAAFAIGSTVRSAVSGLVELEQTQLRLNFLMGRNGQQASEAFKKVQDFALAAPFSVADANAGFQALLKQGLNPSIAEMNKLGDIATFSGKTFTEFADTLKRAQELDLTALEELGVTAEQAGSQIRVGFGGQSELIDGNSEAVRNYIMSLSESPMVFGAMNEASNTTGGQIDRLKDQFGLFTTQLGKALKPAIEWSISGLSWLTQKLAVFTAWVQANWDWIGKWVAVIGKLTLALGGAWAAMKVFRAGQAIIVSITAAWGFLTNAVNIAKIAQIAFNAVAKVSPLGWIGIAVGAITTLFGLFTDLGNWLKETFSPIIEFVKKALQPLIDMVKWLIDAWDKLFMGGVGARVREARAEINAQSEETKKQQEAIDARRAALGKGATDAQGRTGRGMLGKRLADSGLAPKEEATEPLFPKIDTNLGGSVSQGLSGVSEVASQQRNIVVNIDKLIEQFVVNTQETAQSEEEISEIVTRAILAGVNDVNNS